MKIRIAYFLLIFMVMGCSARADSEELGTARRKSISDYSMPGMQNKISIDLRGMDIVDVLKFLAIEGNLNIVAGKNIGGPVSLLINDVTIGDALEIVLATNNLAYEVRNNIIKVVPAAEYKAQYGEDFYDQRKTVIYQLEFASAKNLGTMLGNVKSEIGKIIYDDKTGTIVLIDTPQKISEMEAIIGKSELPTVTRVLPTQTRVFELKYAIVEDIKEEISKFLTEDIGTMQIDTRTNSLVIVDLPHQMKKIEDVISAFDRKTREVFIEAKIIEVTLSDSFKWGIDWKQLTELQTTSGVFGIETITELPVNLTDQSSTLSISSLSDILPFEGLLEMLQTVGDTKVISNPHITVQEGKDAVIKVIENQPYQEETTVTADGGTTTTSKTYQWVEVGVTFNVVPTINEDGYIKMEIKPEVSTISEWYGGSPQAAGSVPVVKSSNAETTVTIKDGVTIIIAGLISDRKTETISKVPILGSIPLLGMLFRNKSDILSRTETVVFLTPRIISGDETFLLEKDDSKAIKGIRE